MIRLAYTTIQVIITFCTNSLDSNKISKYIGFMSW